MCFSLAVFSARTSLSESPSLSLSIPVFSASGSPSNYRMQILPRRCLKRCSLLFLLPVLRHDYAAINRFARFRDLLEPLARSGSLIRLANYSQPDVISRTLLPIIEYREIESMLRFSMILSRDFHCCRFCTGSGLFFSQAI